MADLYANTVLQEARAWLRSDDNKRFELRPTLSQVLPAFLNDREYTIPSLKAIKESTQQVTKAEYFKAISLSIGSSKSCSPSGQTGASDIVTVDWTLKNFAVKMNESQLLNNDADYAQALAAVIWDAERQFWTGASGIDAALITYMEANKTGVNAISTNGGSRNLWLGGGQDIVQVANADRDRFYNYAQADMEINDYVDPYYDIHDTGWDADALYYKNQGGGNSTNTEFQYDGFKPYKSNRINPSGYYNSIHYLIPRMGVAFLDWNDPKNRAGRRTGEKQWTTMQSLFYPELTFDVFITESCADTSSDGGTTQDFVTTWEFTLNYAICKQPLSTADETPIFKYGVLSS